MSLRIASFSQGRSVSASNHSSSGHASASWRRLTISLVFRTLSTCSPRAVVSKSPCCASFSRQKQPPDNTARGAFTETQLVACSSGFSQVHCHAPSLERGVFGLAHRTKRQKEQEAFTLQHLTTRTTATILGELQPTRTCRSYCRNPAARMYTQRTVILLAAVAVLTQPPTLC